MKKLILIITCLILNIVSTHIKAQSINEIKELKQIGISNPENINSSIFCSNTESKSQKGISENISFGTPPDLNWVKKYGGSGQDFGNDILVDSDGYIYITGSFSSIIKIGGTTYTSSGLYDAFAAKFDNAGNNIWLTQFPASANESVIANSICLDGSNNVYIAGHYTGNVTFGSTNLPNSATENLFFVKLNNSGSIQLCKNHETTNTKEKGLKIDTDNSGNIYVLGAVGTIVEFLHESVIIKYDSNGNEIWVQEHPECFRDLDVFNSSIYYSGAYSTEFGDGELSPSVILNPIGSYEKAFIAKADLDGDFIWGVSSDLNGYGRSIGNFIYVDENEDILISGYYNKNIIWEDDTLASNTISNGFISKFSSLGNLQWSKKINSTTINGIYADTLNNVYAIHPNNRTNYKNIVKYDPNGNELFSKDLSYLPNAIAISDSSNIFTTGTMDDLIFVAKSDTLAKDKWSRKIEGDASASKAVGMVTDNLGNIYTYSNTTNSIEFLGQNIDKSVFISKQSPDGNLLWIKSLNNVQIKDLTLGNYICIDTIANYIYITGSFNEELKINAETTLTPGENGSTFIIKYDLEGNYILSIQENFISIQPSIISDPSGNIILSGIYENNILIGNQELENTNSRDGFIAKYNSQGSFLWAKKIGGDSIDYNVFASTDGNGNIYVSGEFTSQNLFIGNTSIVLEEGDGNTLLIKLNGNGDLIWYKSYAKSHTDYGDYHSWPTGIKTLYDGTTYLKGWCGNTIYFDDIALITPNNYTYGYYISKIDSAGNVLWAKSITKYFAGYDYNQFDVDFEGNVYFGASTRDTLYFNNGFIYASTGKEDLFFAKYTSDGNLDWVKTMGSNEFSYNNITSVSVYKNTNIFVTGFFKYNLTIDDQVLTSNNIHGFIAMFGADVTEPTGLIDVYNSKTNGFKFYPNPSSGTLFLDFEDKLIGEFEIINSTGQIVHSEKIQSPSQQIDLSNLNTGIYFIRIKNNKNYKTEKLIVK